MARHTSGMPKPRKRLVSLSDTPYYHCISRCVRRAFLCGVDPLSGFDFSHRRGWIVNRMEKLTSSFAIELCAYAVMSNHYHVVVRVDRDRALAWTEREVVARWLLMFKAPDLVQRWLAGADLDAGERATVSSWVACRRERLCNLSWFMRCLNECIARLANEEDHCTGRFWEGRFKSQALLDERALLACMAYVDLNPIRAGIARTPEHSHYTSIKERCKPGQASSLRPFSGDRDDEGIPYTLPEYLHLVDWSGRAIRAEKGNIPQDTPPILDRLGMQPMGLLDYLEADPRPLASALGPVAKLRQFARSIGGSFVKGIGPAARLCPEQP